MNIAIAVEDRRPKWLQWLHRVGYVTTALVLAEISFVAVIGGRAWFHDREIRAELAEESRTHETPLLPSDDRYVRGTAIELLRKLTPLDGLHGNGLRFVAMPTFGTAEYGVVLSLPRNDASQANGVLSSRGKQDDQQTVRHREFVMPAAAFRSLMLQIDTLTDGWSGDADRCLDGTPAAFERIRGARVTSGIGNCSPHYTRLKSVILKAVRQFAPGVDLPTEDDWHRLEPGKH